MKKAAEKDDKEKRKREKKERKDVKKRDRSSMSAEELLRLDEVNTGTSLSLWHTPALLWFLSFTYYIIYLNCKLCQSFTNFFILSYKCALGYHILRWQDGCTLILLTNSRSYRYLVRIILSYQLEQSCQYHDAIMFFNDFFQIKLILLINSAFKKRMYCDDTVKNLIDRKRIFR